jgi:calcium-dependent protein kinase
VTELYGGGDLIDYLEERVYLPEGKVQVFMNKLLSCMEYLHDSRHMVHRDLKLENILLDTDQDLQDMKLIDFGLAQHFDTDNNTFHELVGSTAYVAPQVIEGEYTEKCDLWSCGVIAYSLLSGYTPFEGMHDGETLQTILIGRFDFNDVVWDAVSQDAKDFICNLLAYEENERPTARQALAHPWLQQYRRNEMDESTTDMDASLRESIRGLRHFTSKGCKLKQAACAIMASQLLKKEEKESINTDFRFLNRSLCGSITCDDLRKALHDLNMDDSDYAVGSIMDQVNFSGSGNISYSEFTIAMMFERDIVDETRLRVVFTMLDKDGDGKISVPDLQAALKLSEDACSRMLSPLHCDAPGMLSFDNFSDAMFSDASMDGSNFLHSSYRMDDFSTRRAFGQSMSDIPTTVLEEDEDFPEYSTHSQKKEEEEFPECSTHSQKKEEEESPKEEQPPYNIALQEPKAAEPPAVPEAMSLELKRTCFHWYMRFGYPDKKTMIRRVLKMGTECPITVEDVEAMPWACAGAIIPVKEINAANQTNVNESGDITNKRNSLRDIIVQDDIATEEPEASSSSRVGSIDKETLAEPKPEIAKPSQARAAEGAAKSALLKPSEIKVANKTVDTAKPPAMRTTSTGKSGLKVSSTLTGTPNGSLTTEKTIDAQHSFSGRKETVVQTRTAEPRKLNTIFAGNKKAPDFDWKTLENTTLKIASLEERKQIKPEFEWNCIAKAEEERAKSEQKLEEDAEPDEEREEEAKPEEEPTSEEVKPADNKEEPEEEEKAEQPPQKEKVEEPPREEGEHGKLHSLDDTAIARADYSPPQNKRMSASEGGGSQRRSSTLIWIPGAKSAESQKMKFPKNERRISSALPANKPTQKEGKRRVSSTD